MLRLFSQGLLLAAWIVLPRCDAVAQPLAARWYGVADGLAGETITDAIQDSRGFLWFATTDGLSRYDGREFRSYTTDDGLPSSRLFYVTEDHAGRVWVVTSGGLARMMETPEERVPLADHVSRVRQFIHYRVGDNRVAVAKIARDGSCWSANADGLYHSADPDREPFARVLEFDVSAANADSAIEDSAGRLWFAVAGRLIRVEAGRATVMPIPGEIDGANMSLVTARRTDLLVAAGNALYSFDPAAPAAAAWQRLAVDLPPDVTLWDVEASDDELWLVSSRGLLRASLSPNRSRVVAENLDRAPGRPGYVQGVLRDRDGNLWVTTFSRGVARIAPVEIRTYTIGQGLPDQNVSRIVEDRTGRMYASVGGVGLFEIRDARAMLVPGSESPAFRGIGHRLIGDRAGRWWFMTDAGVFWMDGPDPDFSRAHLLFPSAAPPRRPRGDGLYQESNGALWASPPGGGLYRIERSGEPSPNPKVVPAPPTESGAVGMIADSSGVLWFKNLDALFRLEDGQWSQVATQPGLSETTVRSMFVDSRGWLWLGLRTGGASVLKAPGAGARRFESYSRPQGLSSTTITTIAEDRQGRLYFGTPRGVDRLDVVTGRIRHFSELDGMPGPIVYHCLRDSRGDIWVATNRGLARLTPEPVRPQEPPASYITGLRVAGETMSMPARGAVAAGPLTLVAAQTSLAVEYVAPSFQDEGALYRYRLIGSDSTWSAPTRVGIVTYARLPPGSYRFEVAAVTASGASGRPATASLEIRPPVWRRWWFTTSLSILTLGIVAAFVQQRRQRARGLERVRQQVALDLHDDIGSGLTQIAMISELARTDPGAVPDALGETADLARSLRESMGDIVWAIDSRKDRLLDLVQRCRQTAYKLLERNGVRVDFRAPAERPLAAIELRPDRRRHVLLLFKEAVTNIARHAGASSVQIAFTIDRRELRLTVVDDGKGFDMGADVSGHGLAGLRTRAEALGGRLSLRSTPGAGTTVDVVVPLR